MITAHCHWNVSICKKKDRGWRHLVRSESTPGRNIRGVQGKFPPPIRLKSDPCPAPEYSGVPLHDIYRNQKKHPPGCSYRGGYYNGRNCRVVLAAAAEEDLKDLVDDKQDEG